MGCRGSVNELTLSPCLRSARPGNGLSALVRQRRGSLMLGKLLPAETGGFLYYSGISS